jgi:hypothetical protein
LDGPQRPHLIENHLTSQQNYELRLPLHFRFHCGPVSSASDLKSFQQCSIQNLLDTDLYFLEGVTPPGVKHYEARRDRLANALVADGGDAFVVEPGYTFKYYANVSQPEWEVWEVSCSFHPIDYNDEVATNTPPARRTAVFDGRATSS